MHQRPLGAAARPVPGVRTPLIHTPGDNEWTDCQAAEGAPGYEPLERLAALRATFFNTGQVGGITFITLHLVGSNNNRGRTAEGDAEYAARNDADIAWLREGFAAARASRALMIIQQANLFPAFPPFRGGTEPQASGFADLRAALEGEAPAYGKPVVLVPHRARRRRNAVARKLHPGGNIRRPVASLGRGARVRGRSERLTFRPRIVERNVADR